MPIRSRRYAGAAGIGASIAAHGLGRQGRDRRLPGASPHRAHRGRRPLRVDRALMRGPSREGPKRRTAGGGGVIAPVGPPLASREVQARRRFGSVLSRHLRGSASPERNLGRAMRLYPCALSAARVRNLSLATSPYETKRRACQKASPRFVLAGPEILADPTRLSRPSLGQPIGCRNPPEGAKPPARVLAAGAPHHTRPKTDGRLDPPPCA